MMEPAQAIIKAKDVEVPVIALREPLAYIAVLLAAILIAMWIRRRR